MRRPVDAKAFALVTCGAVAAFLYANFLIDWTRRGFNGMDDIVSQLEAQGQPNAMLLRVTDVVCAVLVVALLPWVRRALPRGVWRELCVWGTVVFAAGATIAAIVPTPCGPDVSCAGPGWQIGIHDNSSIASDAALYVGVASAWLATRRTGPDWFRRVSWWVFWVGGMVTSLLFAWFNATDDPHWAPGLTQRLHIVCISAWIVCLSVLAARHRPTADPHLAKEHDHARTA